MGFPRAARAVVTGAAGGLGAALCREIVARGGRVVASDLDLDKVSALANELGPSVHPVRCDVTKIADVEAMAAEAQRFLGAIDLAVNNAGVAVGGRVGDIPIADWEWIVSINLMGVVHGCHVFTPILRRQRSGHILNVSSTAGLISAPTLSPYNATKAAVVALSESMYAEFFGEPFGVSVLCPTFFRTGIGAAARVHTDTDTPAMIDTLMDRATIQADGVARIALDQAAAGKLYILPHRDGRIMWQIKRLAPTLFNSLAPRLLALRRGRQR